MKEMLALAVCAPVYVFAMVCLYRLLFGGRRAIESRGSYSFDDWPARPGTMTAQQLADTDED